MMLTSEGLCGYCDTYKAGKCSTHKKDLESGRTITVKKCGRYVPSQSYLDLIKSFKDENAFDGKIFNRETFN